MIHENVLQTIGNTPIVRLNQVTRGCIAHVFAKLEYFNPGGSVKDRIGIAMIEDAEQRGLLKPGGTIVEATSGNTGYGLAIAAAVKGYRCIFVLPSKMSQEKIDTLRSFGAQVVVTPTGVEPEDPRSHYSVARRLAQETPNAYLTNQYDNLANRERHFKTTGPEILRQMPQIDAMVAGMGTGGTLCGTGAYLKTQKPSVKLICADPPGSIIADVKKHGKPVSPAMPYLVEGIGEDFIPKNFDLEIIDDVVTVTDRESFRMARDLLHKEGIFAGTSSGAAVAATLKWVKSMGEKARGMNVLVILPDSGDRYMSKIWNDDFMRKHGLIDESEPGLLPVQRIT